MKRRLYGKARENVARAIARDAQELTQNGWNIDRAIAHIILTEYNGQIHFGDVYKYTKWE